MSSPVPERSRDGTIDQQSMPEASDFSAKRSNLLRAVQNTRPESTEPHQIHLRIRRDQAFLDSYKCLFTKTASELEASHLSIHFRGKEELASISEWFAVVFAQIFNPNFALFTGTDRVHSNAHSGVNQEHLSFFKSAGRFVGLAIREGEVLPVHFTNTMLGWLQGDQPELRSFRELMKDLEDVDPGRHSSLTRLINGEVTNETFSIEIDRFGVTETVDLVENGCDVEVTEQRKEEYVRLVTEYVLVKSVKEQLDSFAAGVHEIVSLKELRRFSEEELDQLISGSI